MKLVRLNIYPRFNAYKPIELFQFTNINLRTVNGALIKRSKCCRKPYIEHKVDVLLLIKQPHFTLTFSGLLGSCRIVTRHILYI